MQKDAKSFWNAIAGKVRETVKSMSGKNLQCERYDVTTAPNPNTVKIGVTQPFADTELMIPYAAECAGATVGDTVLVVWWGSLSNAKAVHIAGGPDALPYDQTTGESAVSKIGFGMIPQHSNALEIPADWNMVFGANSFRALYDGANNGFALYIGDGNGTLYSLNVYESSASLSKSTDSGTTWTHKWTINP